MAKLVLVAYPPDDPLGTPLGTLANAYDTSVTVEDDGIGAGSLAIHPDDPGAAWCVGDAYVAAWRDTVAGDPLAGFWVDAVTEVVLSPDEGGGRELRVTGQGPIAVLDEALVWPRAVSGGDGVVQRAKGRWRWTDAHPARVLVRLLEEATARGCLPGMTWDFSRTKDSDGAAWSTEAAQRFSVPIGASLLDIVRELRETGLHVVMTPGLVVRAWDTSGRDLTGSVAFVAGTNIRETAESTAAARRGKSHVVVEGEDAEEALRYRVVRDTDIETALGRRKEGFFRYVRTATPAVLERVGARKLRKWKRLHDGPFVLPVIDTPGQVALIDYTTGDTVSVPTAFAAAGAERIASITLTETENGAYEPTLEFGDVAPDAATGRSFGGDTSGQDCCGGAGGTGDKPGSGGGGRGGGSVTIVDTTDMEPLVLDDFDRAPGAVYVAGSGYGPTFDGQTVLHTDSGFVTAFDPTDGGRTTWIVNPDGWSEVHKIAADETGVYAQYVGGLGAYPDQTRSGVAKFAPDGTPLWRRTLSPGFDPFGIKVGGAHVYVVEADAICLDATTGATVWSHTNTWGILFWSPGPDPATMWGLDDSTLYLIGASGVLGSWALPGGGPANAGFLIATPDPHVLYTWGNNEPGQTTLWRIDADGSSGPTYAEVVTLPVDTANISVDPVSGIIFAQGEDWARAYAADGTPMWGPVSLGFAYVGDIWDQPAARDGVILVFGSGGASGPGMALLSQADGAELVTERYWGADSTAGYACIAGAVGSGTIGLGQLPLQDDTAAWWPGGNAWDLAPDFYGSTMAIVDGVLTITQGAIYASRQLAVRGTSHGEAALPMEVDDWEIEARYRRGGQEPPLTGDQSLAFTWAGTYLGGILFDHPAYGPTVRVLGDSMDTHTKTLTPLGEWGRIKVRRLDGVLSAKEWAESADEPDWEVSTPASDVDTPDDVFRLLTNFGAASGTPMTLEVDWIRVHPIVSSGATVRRVLAHGDGSGPFALGDPFTAGTLRVSVDDRLVTPTTQSASAGTFALPAPVYHDPAQHPAGCAVLRVTYEKA